VRRERGSDRRCSASGDAVIVRKTAASVSTERPGDAAESIDQELVDDLDETGERA